MAAKLLNFYFEAYKLPPTLLASQVNDHTISLNGLVNVVEGSLLNLCLGNFMLAYGDHFGITSISRVKVRYLEFEKTDVEVAEPLELAAKKVAYLARQLRSLRNDTEKGEFVVYTGAGISTSAKIPDYRGPKGMWTQKDKGEALPTCIPLETAIPTYGHRALVKLHEMGYLSYLTSQNVDGLHRRSGLDPSMLSELHGNAFVEKCATCQAEFLRPYDVCRHQGPHFQFVQDLLSQSGIPHITGRKCPRGCDPGMLRDSIVHFGENLPQASFDRAISHAEKAKIALCVGTSLQVTPACDLPGDCVKCPSGPGMMFVVSLQTTGRDIVALKTGGLLIYMPSDKFFELLLKELGADFPNTPESAQTYLEELSARDKATQEADKSNEFQDKPKPRTTEDGQPEAHKPRKAQPAFFHQLGLPPTLVQLPPHLLVSQSASSERIEEGNIKVKLHIEAPERYPVPVGDFLEAVVYSVNSQRTEVTESPFYFSTDCVIGTPVGCLIRFKEGYGVASTAPLQVTHNVGVDGVCHSSTVKVPPLVMARGFLDNLRRGTALKPTQTRVRKHDGTTYIEERQDS